MSQSANLHNGASRTTCASTKDEKTDLLVPVKDVFSGCAKRKYSGDFFFTRRGSFKAVDKVGQFEVDATLSSASLALRVGAASVTLANSSY